MDKVKEKYGLVIGFVTLMILLSNFLSKLETIKVDFGLFTLNMSEYYFLIVILTSSSLYLYMLEAIFKGTKIGNWSIFSFVNKIAYFIFGIVIISPLALIVLELFYFMFNRLSDLDEGIIKKITSFLSVLISSAMALFINKTLDKYLKEEKASQQIKLEEEEIIDLEKARKLYDEGYYSQSILEAFKVMEINLFRILSLEGVRVRRNHFQDLIDNSFQRDILNKKDLEIIKEIRSMRNAAAHLDIAHNQEQAKLTIHYIKELIKKTATYSK